MRGIIEKGKSKLQLYYCHGIRVHDDYINSRYNIIRFSRTLIFRTRDLIFRSVSLLN